MQTNIIYFINFNFLTLYSFLKNIIYSFLFLFLNIKNNFRMHNLMKESSAKLIHHNQKVFKLEKLSGLELFIFKYSALLILLRY